MKRFTLATLVMALCLAVSGSAMAQHDMSKMHGQKMSAADMKMMKVCMAGLSDSEMKTAEGMMMHATKAEHMVMHKRMAMCMADKHKGMDMSKMDDKKGMAHMMSGLKKSEQGTLKGMMGKMTPDQMGVMKKMMMNCCMYGMKHGK